MSRSWAIITGEYPPQPGGVSDYTRAVARGLGAAGDAVRVFAPPGGDPSDAGVNVERLPDAFGPRGLWSLGRAVGRLPAETTVLVQYVPQAFGWKGMNVPFCLWLRSLRRPVWVMFHEVAFPCHRGQPWKHRLLGAVTRRMARLVCAAAERVFIASGVWEKVLHDLGARPAALTWLPVPSNIPDAGGRIDVAPGAQVVGHFGTFAPAVTDLLIGPMLQILRTPGRAALLIGHHGEAFARRLIDADGSLAGRVVATGAVPAERVGAHLRACDVLVQPYADGVSARRGSAMAGLALGVPVVTTDGVATEPTWRDGAVALAAAGTLADTAERLLADGDGRARLGRAGRELYERLFSLERTVERLRS